jgi:hypothetical protein
MPPFSEAVDENKKINLLDAVIHVRVKYDPASVNPLSLRSDLERNVSDFVSMGGLQTTSEDADIEQWESEIVVGESKPSRFTVVGLYPGAVTDYPPPP